MRALFFRYGMWRALRGAMQRRRALVGSLGSGLWPALVLLFPAGITFVSARVFAEGAPPPPPPSCDAGRFVACDGHTEDTYCSFECTDAKRCVCTSRVNASGGKGAVECDNGTTVVAALMCGTVYICEDFALHTGACAGKAEGDSCYLNGNGHCRAGSCMAPSDGGLQPEAHLFCLDVQSAPADAATPLVDAQVGASPDAGANPDPGFGRGNPPSDAAPAFATSPTRSDDSGCSAAPSPAASAAVLLGAPLALGLLLARRRRKREAA